MSLQFEILENAMIYTCEEMGVVLRKSSFSSNIKERQDFSCALFDSSGRLIAQGAHIPVHLGAMPEAVEVAVHEFEGEIRPGNGILLNDPFMGGTHLPDITLVTPIFYGSQPIGFAANRAHHADVGGSTPGSMNPKAKTIDEEGVRISPTRAVKNDRWDAGFTRWFLSRVRNPEERMGDLRAQLAANRIGQKRTIALLKRHGRRLFESAVVRSLETSEHFVRKQVRRLEGRRESARDFLDDDGVEDRPVEIRVALEFRNGKLRADFNGSAEQTKGPVNAPISVARSAVYYVFRCIFGSEVPVNDGYYQPIHVAAPSRSVVNAEYPAAVAGGNVETSQRIVDVVFKALSRIVPEKVPAACQGTMNNLSIGKISKSGEFTYYETIAGGFGGRSVSDGPDGIHSHMTNTLNTPVEALETSYPFQVQAYGFVEGSAGMGKFRGGLGVRREIKILEDNTTVSLFGDRQKFSPWGLKGGDPGRPGRYLLVRKGRIRTLASKSVTLTRRGDLVVIETPGGAGYGNPKTRAQYLKRRDMIDEKVAS